MTIFTPYTNSPNDPNYMGYSKEPDPIKPNNAVGIALSGLGDLYELGIKGADEIHKRSVSSDAHQQFQEARQRDISELEARREALGGKGIPVGTVPIATPEAVSSFAQPEETGVVGPFGRDGTLNDGPLPPQVEQGLKRLQTIGQAGQQGKVIPVGVQMNGEAILSDLMQRYPGRRDMIRSIASNYGFGEARYANALTRDINQMQAAMSSKQGKDAAFERAEAEWLVRADPKYFQRPNEERNSPQYRDFVLERIGHLKAIQSNNNIQKSGLELEDAQDKVTVRKAERYANSAALTKVGVDFTGLMTTLGYKGATSVEDFFTAWQNDPNKIDPDYQQHVGQQLIAFKQRAKQQILADFQKTPVGTKGDTVFSVNGRSKLDPMIDASLGFVDQALNIISTKGAKESFDTAGYAARATEAEASVDLREVTKQFPGLKYLKILNDQAGPQITGQIFTTSGSDVQKPIVDAFGKVINSFKKPATPADRKSAQVRDGVVGAVATNEPDPRTKKPLNITGIIQRYVNDFDLGVDGEIKPQDMQALMDTFHSKIVNPKIPDAYALRFAKAIFTDTQLFPEIKDKHKAEFLKKYAGADVSARIFASGDTALITAYSEWVNRAAIATAQVTASEFVQRQETAAKHGTSQSGFDLTKFYQMEYDPATNKLSARIDSPQEVLRKVKATGQYTTPLQRAAYSNALRELDYLRDDADKINTILDTVAPVLNHNKSEIDPVMLNLLGAMRIKVKSTEGGDKKMNFSAEELPSSGSVADGSLGGFLASPAGVMSPPVMARGRNKKAPVAQATEGFDFNSMQVDDIPEGMSAREFLQKLKSEGDAKYKVNP